MCVFHILKPLIPAYILFTFSGKTVGMRQENIGREMGAAGERLTNWRHLERGGITGGVRETFGGEGHSVREGETVKEEDAVGVRERLG